MKSTLQSKLAGLALSALMLFATIPTPVLVVGATAAAVGTTGCAITAAQMAADGQAVANAVLAIAKITTDPTLAANLITAANGLVSATANWQTGSPTAIINDAAGIVEVALAAIPQTAIFAPLVPIAVAALDIILANTQAAPAAALRATAPNPYHGYKISHRFGRTPVGDFKASWNTAAVKAGLTSLKQ
ncbi:MAG: hypothetical protein WCA89_09650 [Terracidiphilus sp.]|jgi:hypothetical protein